MLLQTINISLKYNLIPDIIGIQLLAGILWDTKLFNYLEVDDI